MRCAPFGARIAPPVVRFCRSLAAFLAWLDMKGALMRAARGFTLIEMMITVVIVAILASVAWPSYQSYLQRSRRADAQSLMMSIVSKEQQYLLDARQYTDVLGAGGLAMSLQGWDCTLDTAKTCRSPFYDITVTLTAGPPPGFTVTGTP